jgi:hypothetical protein
MQRAVEAANAVAVISRAISIERTPKNEAASAADNDQ